MTKHSVFVGVCIAASALATTVHAGDAEVVDAQASCVSRTCSFAVTVRHEDTGWEHYADRWRILTKDGEEIGRRVLLHPHESEQPFTRSLDDVQLPKGVQQVIIEAHDSVHGYGGTHVEVTVP